CSTLLFKVAFLSWHARRDSNPQPAVLETAALPIELLAYMNCLPSEKGNGGLRRLPPFPPGRKRYLTILATTPAPTVRPPSRIAKRRPSSIATGLISATCIFTLSPGITISTPSGRVTAP